ncbi:hypothetical protein B0H17DRAFT_1203867 [Mycena rosella]|uniref:Uncharacterized protein n=1 Tax=Mycena rosella TaxID=1033263 RepID=A0AAD7DAH7_MYCRO|nr:hypothetical protein B0H17DRAFT_1203867 [Mycena rosella]
MNVLDGSHNQKTTVDLRLVRSSTEFRRILVGVIEDCEVVVRVMKQATGNGTGYYIELSAIRGKEAEFEGQCKVLKDLVASEQGVYSVKPDLEEVVEHPTVPGRRRPYARSEVPVDYIPIRLLDNRTKNSKLLETLEMGHAIAVDCSVTRDDCFKSPGITRSYILLSHAVSLEG